MDFQKVEFLVVEFLVEVIVDVEFLVEEIMRFLVEEFLVVVEDMLNLYVLKLKY